MNIICVDDERPALDNFRLTVKDFPEIKNLQLFQSGNLSGNFKNIVEACFSPDELLAEGRIYYLVTSVLP